MPETKYSKYEKLENANGSPAGTLRTPVEVDLVGTDSKGKPLFEPVAQSVGASGGLPPNTIIHSDWADVPGGSLNPGIVIQSEVPPQAAFSRSGRYIITVVNETDVAVDAAFINFEDLQWEDPNLHEVNVGIIHFPVGGSLANPYSDYCPPAFLYCAGLDLGSGLAQGRVEIRLQGATENGGVVGFIIRAV